MNEETKEVKETEEKKEEVKEVKKEETQKSSKSFKETMSGIWNSTPVKFLRKVTKWTLITGGALIGITGAAKAGCSMALEEHDMKKDSEDSPEETTEETPEIPDEIPGDSEETEE
jgi:hypothetical protein